MVWILRYSRVQHFLMLIVMLSQIMMRACYSLDPIFSKVQSQYLPFKDDLSTVRLTVDEPEDLIALQKIASKLENLRDSTLIDILSILKLDPSIPLINSKFIRNEGSMMSSGQKLWRRAKRVIPVEICFCLNVQKCFYPRNGHHIIPQLGMSHLGFRRTKYMDMSIMGIGTNILGYCNDEIDQSVVETVSRGICLPLIVQKKFI